METRDLITKLYKSTYSALINIQSGYIPMVYNLEKDTAPSIISYGPELKNHNCYRILNNNVLRNYDSMRHDVYACSNDLYKDGALKRILCIDDYGKFVDFNKIKIAADERSAYIECTDIHITLKYCIMFMTSTNVGSFNRLAQIHIKNNIFLPRYSAEDISISVDNLYFEIVKPDENGWVRPNLTSSYRVFNMNFFMFKNGLYKAFPFNNNIANCYHIDEYDSSDDWFGYLFYYRDDKSIDNMNKLDEKISILDKSISLNEEYINKLMDSFDYEYDKNKSYEDNLHDILTYISNYNPDGLLEVFKSQCDNVIIESYSGEYMLSKAVNNKFTISRRRKNKLNCYCIVYVNGELFKYHDDIVYGAVNISIPTDHISKTDNVILQLFVDCNNNTSTISFTKGSEDNYLNYKYFSADCSNIQFYSPEFEGKHLYDLTVDDKRQLFVNYQGNAHNGNLYVELDNPYLYGKELTVCSKRQFRHITKSIPVNNKFTLQSEIYDISSYIDEITYETINNLFLEDKVTLVNNDDILFDTDLNYPSALVSNKFSWKLSGYIWIDSDNTYTFKLSTDGGHVLTIDGTELGHKVDGTSTEASISLTKGFHSIEIKYYSTAQYPRISLEWKTNGEYQIFPYDRFYSDKPEYYILRLSETEFQYCSEYGHFLIFADQRRLNAKEAYIRMNGIDQPYDDYYLFISKELPEEQQLDIFYVPDPIMEVETLDECSSDGYITIDKESLNNTFDPTICGMYINGKFIDPSYYKSLSTDTVKLTTDIQSLSSVSIIKYTIYDNLITEIFQLSNDIWTQATKIMPKDITDSFIGDSEELTDTEQDFHKPKCVDLTWAILKKFWISKFGEIDASKLFQYNDEPKILRTSKFRVNKISSKSVIGSNINTKTYIDSNGDTIYDIESTVDNNIIYLGNFEDIDDSILHSIVSSMWFYMDITNTTDRLYYEVYGDSVTVKNELSYNSETINISDIPKCYFVRIYGDELPISSDNNNVRICVKLNTGEKIKFKNAIWLEDSKYSTSNIECIPIDASIDTGVDSHIIGIKK